MKYLKNDRPILIFPEGTRVSEDEAISAKGGLSMLSVRTNSPIVPVYLDGGKIFPPHLYRVWRAVSPAGGGTPRHGGGVPANRRRSAAPDLYAKTGAEGMREILLAKSAGFC